MCSGQQATGGEDQEPNGPALPPRSPSPKGKSRRSGGLLTSHALRSRCRSFRCVLSARPSRSALGEGVTGGSGSWEKGPQSRAQTSRRKDAREVKGVIREG